VDIEILKTIGWIVGALLSVNAWYFRGIVSKLSSIELALVKLSTEHSLMSDMVLKHDKEIDVMREQFHRLEVDIQGRA
jgi:hypothetical protein